MRGAIDAVDKTLQYIADSFDESFMKSLLLHTKNEQNMFHLANMCLGAGKLFEALFDYIDNAGVEKAPVSSDRYNNTPFTYLTANYSTKGLAMALMKIPSWQRRIFLRQRNISDVNCLSILKQRQCTVEFYFKGVLCIGEQVKNEEKYVILRQKAERLYFLHECDANLLGVIKYALDEYIPTDLQLSLHNPEKRKSSSLIPDQEVNLYTGT